MFIPVILGTSREGRRSENAAKFVLDEVLNAKIGTELVDVRDYRIKATDNTEGIAPAVKLAEKLLKSDALIIVSPEYNHSFPGELKMFIDMLYSQWKNKPVGLCGVSIGPYGGTRGIQSLRLACIGVGMLPINEAVYFANVKDIFDQKGKIKDISYGKKVQGMISALTLLADPLSKK